MGQLAGIAAQFGFSIPMAASGESPEFYVALLRSGEIRRAAVRSSYRRIDRAGQDTTWVTGDLVELFEVRGRSEQGRLEGAVEQLGRRMSVGTSPETGMVRLSVQTKWPELSVQIAERLIDLVNEFNLQTRQSQANAEREFVSGQLETARSELARSETVCSPFSSPIAGSRTRRSSASSATACNAR